MIKLTLHDAKGNKISDLKDQTPVLTGQAIGAESDAGPITFILFGSNGTTFRTEKFAPFFMAGDTSGIPVDPKLAVGPYRLLAFAGPNHEQASASFSVTVPPPPPPPPPPAPVLKVVSRQGQVDADGITNTDASGVWIQYAAQSIDVIDGKDHTFTDGICQYARSPQQYRGQGAYVENKGGNIVFRNWLFTQNGYAEDIADRHLKTQWKHGVYINRGGTILFDNCEFDRNASIGSKIMRAAKFLKCLWHCNSIGFQGLYDVIELFQPIFFRGSYHWSDALVGNTAMDIYTDVRMTDGLIVGGPRDTTMDGLDPKPYDGGPIKINLSHSKYTDVPGGKLTLLGRNRIIGWPLESGRKDGLWYSGDGVMTYDNVKKMWIPDQKKIAARIVGTMEHTTVPIGLVLPNPIADIKALGSTVDSVGLTITRHYNLVKNAVG
jgi:hypothetical protein